MPTIRVEITAETVKAAVAMAAKYVSLGAERKTVERDQKMKIPVVVTVWADVRQHYLSIRQRGPAVDWLVRTRGKTRVIGDVRERRQGFLSVRAARDQAASLYGQIAAGDDPNAGPSRKPGGWTWGDLDREYQTVMAAPGGSTGARSLHRRGRATTSGSRSPSRRCRRCTAGA